MTPRIACTTTLSLLLAATATACGDDGGGAGDTENAGSGTTTATSTPTTSPTSPTNPTTNPTTGPTTTDPTTMTTTGPTSSTTEDPSETEDPDTGSDSTGTTLDCPYTPLEGEQQVGFELVASGFNQPLFVLGDPVDKDVLYVVQKGGAIKRLEPGTKSAPAENWYQTNVSATSEMGLLGMAFHPDYETNSLVYVVRATSPNAWFVTEYEVGDDGPDLSTERNVFGSAQPAPNHNGGMIQFGPDGMLYISIGDGGPQEDACGNGQNTDTHLGAILRIDPTADGTPDTATGCGTCNCPTVDGFDYTIPADNPFVGEAGARDEIYAFGFRNPWRFSFDPVDGQLFVADVGQYVWEEVTVVEAGTNHGWGDMEGAHCFSDGGCDTAAAPGATNSDDLVLPVAEYQHGMGRNSITGLGNYRSCEVPGFAGLYFYSDLSTGEVWAVSYQDGTAETFGPVGTIPNNLGPWGGGYNAYGDVFIAANPPQGGAGSVYRITAAK